MGESVKRKFYRAECAAPAVRADFIIRSLWRIIAVTVAAITSRLHWLFVHPNDAEWCGGPNGLAFLSETHCALCGAVYAAAFVAVAFSLFWKPETGGA